MSDVVQKLWGFCHTLRHEGIDYGDYIEQITYLLFLKMADERSIDLSALPYEEEAEDGRRKSRKKDCSWPALRERSGVPLTDHYAETLRILGKQPGILGDIYAGAQSRFHNPVNLKKLVSLIDETEWTSLGVDVKAEAYEGLLEKAASEGKKGAGQYFTPRVLIQSIVRCMRPDPRVRTDFTIADPACGTGGFLVAAYEWLVAETRGGALDRNVTKRIRTKTYHGQELVARPRRMALMNLYLHHIEPDIRLGDTIYETASSERFDVILTNPPFGTKGANQAPDRDDFTIETSNKQLNFLQHILTVLKPGGRAAVVLPDNCLFDDKAGEVFEIITRDCDVHTILRLPSGTFTPYSQGVKANVVFFTKGYPTERVWIYDARTDVPGITQKDRPLTASHFAEFELCYGSDPSGRSPRDKHDSKEDRWRSFTIAEVKERDFKFVDLRWLRDRSLSQGLPEARALAADAIADLAVTIEDLTALMHLLGEVTAPASRTTIRVGELGQWLSGGTPSRSRADYWSGGSIPWVSPKDMKRDFLVDSEDHLTESAIRSTNTRLLPVGSVLCVVRGMILAHSFPVAVNRVPVAINQDIRALIPAPGVDGEFVLRALQAKRMEVLRMVKESTHGTRRLDSEDLYSLEIELPDESLQHQRTTVVNQLLEITDRVQQRVSAQMSVVLTLQQSVLAKVFAGEPRSASTGLRRTQVPSSVRGIDRSRA